MNFLKKYILLFSILISILYIDGQNSLRKGDLESRFIKDQIEVAKDKSFFNILYIKNTSNKTISFNIQYNTPKDWEVVGEIFQKMTLTALGDVSIPVRVTLSKKASGGVGYAVVAIISDEEGSVFNTVYSFVKIPTISLINVKFDKTSKYFNQQSLSSTFGLNINNSGNIDEIVGIKFIADKSLTIKKKNNSEEIKIDKNNIHSGESTSNFYNVFLNKGIDIDKYKIHKVKVNVSFRDSVIKKIMWFRFLDWEYLNSFPETNRPLNVEFNAYNLFGNTTPTYSYRVYGNVLLKKKRDISYLFQNTRRVRENNLWLNTRVELKYNTVKSSFFIGDYRGNFEHSLHGRGVYFDTRIKKNGIISAAVTKSLTINTDKYALEYKHSFKNVFLRVGGVYINNSTFLSSSKLAYSGIRTKIFNNNLTVSFGYNQTDNSNLSSNTYSGWGYRARYSGKIKNVDFKLNSNFGTPNYIGFSSGRLYNNAMVNVVFSNNKHLRFQYFSQEYRPSYIVGNELLADKFTFYQRLKTSYFYKTSSNILLFGGPIFEQERTNNFNYVHTTDFFSSISAKIEGGIKLNNKFTDNTIIFSGRYGLTSIYEYSTILNGISYENMLNPSEFTVAQISASYFKKNYGVHLMYYVGPYSLSQQFSYFYGGIKTKSLRLIPFYEKKLFKNKFLLSVRASYSNNFTSQSTRLNMNTALSWFPGKGWSARFGNTSSIQRSTLQSVSQTHSSSFFEFGISKSFNIQQPRLKYYDYKAIFYRDLNGNRIHDPNEPGVSDVLVDIQRANPEDDLQNENYNGEFLTNKLLSNEVGEIQYVNIAEGDYNINYLPQEVQTSNYGSDGSVKTFNANKDTVMYIPFMERNKLFGKINLNRTKHTALGEIPINNIKVVVEGNSNTYTTLTDKEGNFELFIPVADYYKVKINNIFKEYFALRQEYFIVKFNGYKKFELSFEFDEKERKIEFDENDFLMTDEEWDDKELSFDDIDIIKQTNIKGIVKDANSLTHLHSTVSVRNRSNNQLISETASSKRTGVYFTSFFAGENYYIKVAAYGYWTYKQELSLNQVTTFENITHDVLLTKISLDEDISPQYLLFETEKYTLSELAKAELDKFLSKLFLNPSVNVEIAGYTDNLEALLSNPKQLSSKRANAVAKYLFKNGLKKRRVNTKGVGESYSKTFADTNAGRAKSRRVEIKVSAF